ncbi:MAG: potassium channel protein [Acidimicrobiia bacterium]|nr:potassium channel protein [Acidimicrobiia bacterium]
MTPKNPLLLALAQRPALAALALSVVIASGTLGYVLIEGWGPWDALYMTVITITAVGYREVRPLSRPGEAFTMVLLFAGVGTALYTFTLIATTVVEGGLPARLQVRRRERMLETLQDHYIICGYGRIGSTIARQFVRERVPFVIVERDAPRYQSALDDGFLAIDADASREDVLRRAGIDRARGLIAVVGTDAENVYTVLSARSLAPGLVIVGRAETEDAVHKLKRAGASRVVSPYQIGAVQIAHTALRPSVVDFVELATSSENLELAIEEIPVSSASGLANRSILEVNLRQRYDVIVVGIQREGGRMEFNPEPDTPIRSGDTLVVLGRPHSLKRLEAEAIVS